MYIGSKDETFNELEPKLVMVSVVPVKLAVPEPVSDTPDTPCPLALFTWNEIVPWLGSRDPDEGETMLCSDTGVGIVGEDTVEVIWT